MRLWQKRSGLLFIGPLCTLHSPRFVPPPATNRCGGGIMFRVVRPWVCASFRPASEKSLCARYLTKCILIGGYVTTASWRWLNGHRYTYLSAYLSTMCRHFIVSRTLFPRWLLPITNFIMDCLYHFFACHIIFSCAIWFFQSYSVKQN